MKITKSRLKQIIKEEYASVMDGALEEVANLDPEKINMIRKAACTKFGQRGLVKMAEAVLDNPTDLEKHLSPLAVLVPGMDTAQLAKTIKSMKLPDLGLPMQPKTVGQALQMLSGFLGDGLRSIIKPQLPQAVAMACDLSLQIPLEESTRKITKEDLKFLIKEELRYL